LHAEVASASDALSKISAGAIQVTLAPHIEAEDGVTYRLHVETNNAVATHLGFFRVSQKGYPILFSQIDGSLVHQAQEFSDRTKLKTFFYDMASNPDSPLIQKVAYLMRKKRESTSDIPL
jgi:hypothetical protein